MGTKIKAAVLDWLLTIVIAVCLSLGIRTYVAEAMWIPSESMAPTLKIGDHLLIDKLLYKISGIKRGDIIVFNPPQAANLDDKVLIKRVIALPGETIAIKNGLVYINGMPLNEPYIFEKAIHDFGPYIVPNDAVFVMGDNRNNSYDSRSWGALPVNNIIGKAELRYYPLNKIGILGQAKN